MGVIQIRKAQREGARLVVGLAGISGSGKTRTAIELAYGLANFDASKVGFLDTENRRGSLYSDVLRTTATRPTDVPFWIGDLEPPFSPQRYIDAIMEFQRHGVEVLVIDSVTHEWEGTGGCEEIAEANAKRGMKDWAMGKREHKRFMNVLLQSDMHIIACIRAREKVEILKEKGENGRTETVVKSLGIMPVTEKNVMFEMTASLMMWDAGKQQQVMKCPQELLFALGRQQGYITADDGNALRQWVDGAKQLDPEIERARNTLRTTTEQGMDALVAAWKALPAAIRKAINPAGTCPEDLKKSAEAFDKQRAEAKQQGDGALDDLNNQVLGDGAQTAAAE